MSSSWTRWSGLAAILGGAMWVVKGGLVMLGGPDPDLFIPAQLFFALGLLGLYTQLAGRGGVWEESVGSLLTQPLHYLQSTRHIPLSSRRTGRRLPSLSTSPMGQLLSLSLLGWYYLESPP